MPLVRSNNKKENHKRMAKKLFVRNLSYQCEDRELREHFAEFGKIVSAKVVTDRETGESRGFGFVEFETDAEAEKGLSADGEKLMGRQLNVMFAREEEPRTRMGKGRK